MPRFLEGAALNISTNSLTIPSSSYLKGIVVTIRLCLSVLIFGLLLITTIFPAVQIGWSFNILCGSTGDTGSGQTCDFSEAGATADFEDDSPQETPDVYVVSRVLVSDGELSRLLGSMNESPPFILLVSRLFHPPTSLS